MVERVSNTMHNWIKQIFYNRFIKFCIFTFNNKIYFFIKIFT